jgi:hypothetical protein
MSANQSRGQNPYKCTRGNCGDVLAGPHAQDEHNHSKHLMIPTTSKDQGHETRPKSDKRTRLADNLDVPAGV